MSEERNAYHKRWRETKTADDPFYIHRKALKELYKTTKEWYDSKLAEQGGHCALCPATSSGPVRLSVDHNHRCCKNKRTCGKCNRGILCFNCNKLLGHLETFLEQSTSVVPKWDTWLENALLYLTKYGSR